MRTLRSVYRLGFALWLAMLMAPASWAQETIDKAVRQTQPRLSASGTPRSTLLNINNLATWMRSDGQSSRNPSGGEGTLFPRSTSWVVYQDGIVWGGKAYRDAALTQPAPSDQLIRVGGATYRVGTGAGWVEGFGANAVPVNPDAIEVRIYRIRRDYDSMSEDELRRDAAEFNEIDPSQVTMDQTQATRDQYELDWRGWPVTRGAPYIDRNRNAQYDPPPAFSPTFTVDDLIRGGYDEPGIAGANLDLPADQVVWTAFNDLDSSLTRPFSGSEPLGLEIQVSIWGYRNNSALSDVFFRRVRLMNKGGVIVDENGAKGAFWIDGMHLAQWSDLDVGDVGDDLAGCDTSLSAGYVYNGNDIDRQFQQFLLPPPAFGYDLVQGPLVPAPGATAIFDLKEIAGFKNLRMTAFANFASGDAYSDPVPGSYDHGTLRWYKVLRGFLPFDGPDLYYPFPPGVTPNAFPFSGDPVSGSGFVDGLGQQYSFAPGDRRIVVSSGPFRLAPGDTQEVVIAGTGGLGTDRLSSIAAMRYNMRAAQSLYDQLLAVPGLPEFSAQVNYPAVDLAEITLRADGHVANATAITAGLKQPNGLQVAEIALFDDGAHDDGAAQDGIFANTTTISRKPVGLYVDMRVTDSLQVTRTYHRVFDNLTTAGPVDLDAPEIFSDNLNNDGEANPEENIRYGLRVRNQTAFDFSNLRLSPVSEFEIGKTIQLAGLTSGQSFSFAYNPNVSDSYFSFEVPDNYSDPGFTLAFAITDNQNNRWLDTLAIAIVPVPVPFTELALEHVAGKADGTFLLRVIDRAALKNHVYEITGVDSINAERERGFTLKDLTENRVLLRDHPLPDTLGHNIPVLDGFKILRGTIIDQNKAGMRDWSVPSGQRVWTWSNASDLRLEGFSGAIGWNEPYNYFGAGGKTLKPTDLKNTLIKFAATDTAGNVLDLNDPNWSYGYRYGRLFNAAPARTEFGPFIINPVGGYSYQEYKKSVPFSAWDIESDPPRRLMVGHLENNAVDGMVDGKYWPSYYVDIDNIDGAGPREWFFVFDLTYSETSDPRLTKDLISNPVPMMWWGTPARRIALGFAAGDEFLIVASHLITAQDSWIFNPVTLGVAENGGPLTFALAQNYPNPFNPETRIAYSLPVPGKVSLKVFNMLGQEVITLVNERMAPGKYVEIWQGRNRAGSLVASGVYFYRLEVTDSKNEAVSVFVQTHKMILVR
jgi:hypothetical protein